MIKKDERIQVGIFGTYQVGKSIFFNQIRKVENYNLTEEELTNYKHSIYQNINYCLKQVTILI